MESFKANFIIFVFIVGVLALGLWAIRGIDLSNQSIIEGYKSVDIGPVLTTEPDEAGYDLVQNPIEVPVVTTSEPKTEPTPSPATDNKNSVLIDKLEQLIEDKVLMKKGSRGTRVGTVQQFLKLYGINMTVDNDYGDTTVNAVKKFQTEQKLPADGQAGESTYHNMIEWLENN